MSGRVRQTILASLVGMLGLLSASDAQDVEDRLDRISSRLEAASEMFRSDEGLNMPELSKLAVELESIMAEMREISRDYGAARKQIEERFRQEGSEYSEILGYMVTLNGSPAPDFLIHPDGALGAIRANMIVGAILPSFEDKIAGIASDVGQLRDLRERQDRLNTSTAVALEQINALREDLVIAERSGQQTRVVTDPDVLDALFSVSDNLADFVRGLQQLPMQGETPPLFSVRETKGTWTWPATGMLEDTLEGKNILTHQQLITTTLPGTVRFADKFLSYGKTIILEPQKGYLLVLAGFDEILVKEGDIVDLGDLLGYFGHSPSSAVGGAVPPVIETEARKLYVELRKNGIAQPLEEYFMTKEE